MIVTCPGCASKYRVRNEAVPQEGARMRCPKCDTLFLAKPPVGDDASAPAPAPPPPAVSPAMQAAPTRAAAPAPVPAQRSLQSFQQVAPSQLQQLPSGPQMDMPQTGLAQIPAGFVVPGAGWSKQLQPSPAPVSTPQLQLAPIPSPNMGANPLFAPGPITGLFQLPVAQPGQPQPQRPMQGVGAQPRDLMEELGLPPAGSAPAPILPDDDFFDRALAGAPPAPPPGQRRLPSSAPLDLDGPTNTQGYIPISMSSQPGAPPITGSGQAVSSTTTGKHQTVAPTSTGKHQTVAPTAAPTGGSARETGELPRLIGSWALVTLGGAACALGLMFAGWTAGALDLDRQLLPVLSQTLGVDTPYAFDGKSGEALDAVVQRAQAARARGDFADEVLQWTRVLQRDPRYGGAEDARRQALQALGAGLSPKGGKA